MIESTQDHFARDVVEASHEIPVLVDFWAPWCGPCRVLGPILEKMEAEYDGRFRLIKIDSDQNPDLSAEFAVRSIPYVLAFVDGRPVDAFVGALPESQLRAFIDRVIPDAGEIQRRKAARLLAQGDRAGATTSLRAAVALDPENPFALTELAALLVDAPAGARSADDLAEAKELIARVSRRQPGDSAIAALQTRIAALELSASLPARADLEARIEADSDDLQLRLDLANRLIAERDFAPALEQLLAVVERDRTFGEDAARKTMLAVFDLAADQRDLVAAYRRRLAAALNR